MAKKTKTAAPKFESLAEAQTAYEELQELYEAAQAENSKLKATAEAAKETGVAMPTVEVAGELYRVRAGIYVGGNSYTAQQIAANEALAADLVAKGSGVIEKVEKGGKDA